MRIIGCINRVFMVVFMGLVFVSSSLSSAETNLKIEGQIEFDYPFASSARVEVNLTGDMFSLVAKQVRDPEVQALLSDLKSIRVRVYDRSALGEKSLDDVMAFYEDQLRKEKWDVLARVKEKDSRVSVWLLTTGDIVTGLVVLAGEPEEIVVVNLAGKIDITKIPEIGKMAGANLNLPKELGLGKILPDHLKRQREQEEKAIEKFLGNDTPGAISALEELEKEGISDRADHALMALFHQLSGDPSKSSYELGRFRQMEKLPSGLGLSKESPSDHVKRQREQEEKAIETFFNGDTFGAILALEELEKEGISDRADYALMALFHHLVGDMSKSFYDLGKFSEIGNLKKDLTERLYRTVIDIDPDSETAKKAAEKLGENRR